MLFPLIKDLLHLPAESQNLTIRGWVKTKRELKNRTFVEVNDGSSPAGIQCIFDRGRSGPPGLSPSAERTLETLATGSSVAIQGRLVASPGSGQAVELAAYAIERLGDAPPETYPLQKKRHSLEFLREIAHLRARTGVFAAVARVRSRLAFGVHRFFQEQGFHYIHTPIITGKDAEGAGALFQVTTLDLKALAQAGKAPDYGRDFFGKPAYLTVSGQLEAETYAAALSRVYTFGPTFRAEHSNTTRHLAEFWMIEPEIAFADLADNIQLAEAFLKYLCTLALRDCAEDLAFIEKRGTIENRDARIETGSTASLQKILDSRFVRMSYTDAVAALEKEAARFTFKPFWGGDLQSEHEKFLTENIVGGPVIVIDYPKDIKAFYMKLNDDEKTVRAMDVLVPRLGEIIGGSQREEDYRRLENRMRSLGMPVEDYAWYLDLRRYGTVPHVGFGMGFERLIQYITGMVNIRDVIPYPRVAGQAEF
ncbi:MAG: asparagine--tRNA ligase [Treponema sp.]|jgi:asparaginyl-tRNA synthetase|nr:asparagine--tRNA ligase [Treponema sp.]